MASFYAPVRRWITTALTSLLTLSGSAAWAASPPIYSFSGNGGAQVTQTCTTTGIPPVTVTTCFGSVTNPERATDSDFGSAAIINVPTSILGGSVRLRMDLAATAPANYRAGVMVQRRGGVLNLLGLNTANLIVVRTYLKTGTTSVLQEERAVDATVARAILSTDTDPRPLEFVATRSFNQIEVEAASLLSLAYDLNVFYAYALDANVVNTANGYVSRFATPGPTQYSTQVVQNGVTVCVNSNVTNPQNTVDRDLTNFALMGSVADLSCPQTLQTQLEGTAPAGYYAGFLLGSNSVLDASVLSGLRLVTYLNGVPQETATGAGLLNLQVLPNQQYQVSFPATKPYDRVEIQRTSLLSALDNLRIYHGFGLEPRVFRDQQPRLSSFVNPDNNYQVNGSVVCVNCSVTDPQNVADKDLTSNYATVRTTLAVGGTTRLKMRLDGAGKAGNTAGVVLGLGSRLLDASLLSSIRINTYSGTNGATKVESYSGSSLLRAELLADGRQEVSFLTTRDFDWVEIELTNGVSLLDNTQVYYGFAEDRPTGFPANIVVPTPLPVQLTAFAAKASGTAVVLTWQTASELNSSAFVVERATQPEAGFVPVGRVAAAGMSTTTRQYTLRDAEAGSLAAGLLYYRLRQLDADGTETYSGIVVVQLKNSGLAFSVSPNPASATDQVRLTLPTLPEGQYHLLVYDMQGSVVGRQPVVDATPRLAANHLRAGLYQVALVDAAGQRLATQRLVVSGR